MTSSDTHSGSLGAGMRWETAWAAAVAAAAVDVDVVAAAAEMLGSYSFGFGDGEIRWAVAGSFGTAVTGTPWASRAGMDYP